MNGLKDIIDFSRYKKRLDLLILERKEEYKLDVQDMLYELEKKFRLYKDIDHFTYSFQSHSSKKDYYHFFSKPYFMNGHITFQFFNKHGEELSFHKDTHDSFQFIFRMLRHNFELDKKINIFNEKGARNNRLKLYQKISDKYELPETFMEFMNKNSGFFRSQFFPFICPKHPNVSTKSRSLTEFNAINNKYSNTANIIINIEKIFYAKILIDIGRGLTLNYFDKINFTGDGIHFAGKNKNLEYTQKLREDCYYFRHLFGYCVKEKENKTLITPQIFDQIINNYQKIEHIENFSNKVKTYLNELSAEKQYNILTDIFVKNEFGNKEKLQTRKRL